MEPGESECGEMWFPLGLSMWKLTELPFVYGDGGGTGGGSSPGTNPGTNAIIFYNFLESPSQNMRSKLGPSNNFRLRSI
jgi:hypothetical protein